MLYGYAGKLLDVNLSTEKIKEVELKEETLSKYLGGRGLGAYILLKELGKNWDRIDPLGEENLLLILTGPLVGYYPGIKVVVTGKSPQSNGVVGSTLSSEVGIELRSAGYDGIIIRGRAKSPVYLYIENENVEIRDAEKYWGMTGYEFYNTFSKELMKEAIKNSRGSTVRETPFLYIGLAGENLVRIASVMSKWAHAAGYGGYGAVMGSKKLKAIAVRGSGPLPKPYDQLRVRALIRAVREDIKKSFSIRYWGTGHGGYSVGFKLSSEPIRNWQEEWHNNKEIGVDNFERRVWKKRFWGDFNCPATCMKISVVRRNGRIYATDAPDYELQAYMGTNLGVFKAEDVAYLSAKVDDLGLCGIQTGNTLGFIAELYQRGILTEEDIGFKVEWGDIEAFSRLIDLIASRNGIGDICAEGTYRAAVRISEMKGINVLDYAIHAKGIGIGAHGVRSGLDYRPFSYATSVQGGDHTSAPTEPFDRGEVYMTLADSAVICSFVLRDKYVWEFINAVTGMKITREKWIDYNAKAILTIQRVLLLLGGPDIYWDPRIHDDIPKRFYEPLPSGPKKGSAPERKEVEELKRRYYEFLGWDELGIPKDETIEKLGLREEISPLIKKIRERLENKQN